MVVGVDSVIPLSCGHAVCICSSFSELPGPSYKESLALCMRNKIIRKSGQPESEAEWETLQPPLLFKTDSGGGTSVSHALCFLQVGPMPFILLLISY